MSGPIVVACELRRKAAPYLDALVAAGAPPDSLVLLTPEDPPPDPPSIAAAAAGLVLCGGPDVDPARYGAATNPGAAVEVDAALDALDLGLLDGARAARVPVLGICRGLQVINVFCGGTLWQDLASERPSPVPHDRRRGTPKDLLSHPVTTVEEAAGLELTEVLGAAPLPVNSRHHQGVQRLGSGLVVVAVAADGLVEAFASIDPTDWWIEAVQWHPENLVPTDPHRLLFGRFLAAAGHVTATAPVAAPR